MTKPLSLQELSDREQIRDLLHEYGRSFDERRLEDYANLFAEDGEWSAGSIVARGPAEVLAMVTKAAEAIPAPPGCRNFHVMTNMMIEVDGDRATAWSRFSFIEPGADGSRNFSGSGVYDDELVRRNGRWMFLRRKLTGDAPRNR